MATGADQHQRAGGRNPTGAGPLGRSGDVVHGRTVVTLPAPHVRATRGQDGSGDAGPGGIRIGRPRVGGDEGILEVVAVDALAAEHHGR